MKNTTPWILMVAACLLSRKNQLLGISIRRSLPQHSQCIKHGFASTSLRAILRESSAESLLPKHMQTWLDVHLPEGRCIGVRMSSCDDRTDDTTRDAVMNNEKHWMYSCYHPDEIEYGFLQSNSTAKSFWLGRLATRIALDFPSYPILKDSYGRPKTKHGTLISISHKGDLGVAIVSQDTSLAGIGIDIEYTSRPGKRSIASRVLTEKERDSVGKIEGISEEEEILLRFSLKEAIYKAAHPSLCQYVGFQEAEVTPHTNGTATCIWLLESKADKGLGPITAHWRKLDNYGLFLSSASLQKSR